MKSTTYFALLTNICGNILTRIITLAVAVTICLANVQSAFSGIDCDNYPENAISMVVTVSYRREQKQSYVSTDFPVVLEVMSMSLTLKGGENQPYSVQMASLLKTGCCHLSDLLLGRCIPLATLDIGTVI